MGESHAGNQSLTSHESPCEEMDGQEGGHTCNDGILLLVRKLAQMATQLRDAVSISVVIALHHLAGTERKGAATEGDRR